MGVGGRGEGGNEYPWGNEFECAHANFDDHASDSDDVAPGVVEGCDGYVRTAPVGSFRRRESWCDALDMAGDVFEWVVDRWCWYTVDREVNPTGCSSGDCRVIRGRGQTSHAHSYRGYSCTGVRSDFASSSTGFRCAMNSG